MQRIDDILDFWFNDVDNNNAVLAQQSKLWWRAKPKTDQTIRALFLDDINQAANGHYKQWQKSALGRLALILLFDQFPRNIFRGDAQSFTYDSHALEHCLAGIEINHDQKLGFFQRSFYYMPLQHSEDLSLQKLSLEQYSLLLDAVPAAIKAEFQLYLDYAKGHYALIERFGRFPHRNQILDRKTTAAEQQYLETMQGNLFSVDKSIKRE